MTTYSVNGDVQALRSGTTVHDVVSALAGRTGGCAVAVHDAVIPRSAWSTRPVEAGDRIEVLTAVQGG